MSGLVKAKKYDYKDSNLSLFGSDLERNIKKASAKTETAWANAGKKVGIQVWRIVKFKVAKWPGEDNGKFYSGDSYIILNTYKTPPSDELLYDVHFWIGKYSTQDEYGTAAYKTVELDTLLDDKPVQHREVQGYESDLFKAYFPTMTLMKGGASSGFRHVDPKEYVARLLHVKGEKKKVTVKEVKMFRETLSSGDVFILDRGLEIFQWNGSSANKDEKFRALQYIQGLKSDRSGKPKVETLEERTMAQTHKFYTYLPEGGEPLKAPKDSEVKASEKVLLKVSDADGTLDCEEVARGSLAKSMLDSNDAFIVDSGIACYVWIGKGASPDERKKGMQFAHNYLMKTDHPFVPVTVIIEGQHEEEGFRACFS